MAVFALRRVQWGKESTWGTGVAATAIVEEVTEASASFEDEVDQGDTLGNIGPASEVVQVQTGASFSLTQRANYEQLPYWFDALFGVATPSGTAAPYTYSYTGPTTAVPTSPRITTFEWGSGSNIYDVTGALLSDVTISIDGYRPWTIQGNWIAKGVAAGTFASLSNASTTLVQGANLYIDAYGGTFGSTAVTGNLISASINITTGRHLKYFADSVAPQNWGEGAFMATISGVAEFDATWAGYLTASLSGVVSKSIRIKQTSGTNVAQIDMSGFWSGAKEILSSDRDGNITIPFAFTARYDVTNAMWIAAEVQNTESSMV